MKGRTITIVGLALTLSFLVSPLSSAEPPNWYNGVSGIIEANGYDAPIWRQFSFAEGTMAMYQVLSPEVFLTDDTKSKIFQFPMCETLVPVLPALHPAMLPDGLVKMVDAPTRQIVDVVLSTGCSVQPTTVAEVEALAITQNVRPLWVNAPVVPETLEYMSDEELFNAPPYRPRLDAFMDGDLRQFMTYEASWYPSWFGTAFPNDADVFILSYGPLFRPGFTVLNVEVGIPHDETFRKYSPIWRANCIVDADDQKCMLSVNTKDHPYDPGTGLGYYQCESVGECMEMRNTNGNQVKVTAPIGFTHINCPVVSVDLNADDYTDAAEELIFPDLWLDGPVIV